MSSSSSSSFNETRAPLRKRQRVVKERTTSKLAQLPPPAKQFQMELDKTGFTIFKPIADLGFYQWKPDLKKGYTPLDHVSVEEIKRQLDANGEPALLLENDIPLPFAFLPLPPQTYENKYPMSHYEIAGIYVATKIRGLPLKDIDFVLGGSTLSMLANKNKSNKMYLVTKIPGTSVGLVAKDHHYQQNYAEPGFQFERLVTGKPIDDIITEPSMIEHMQVMQVGPYKVLFIAEVDAWNDGEPVEIACSNPLSWGIQKCLQCISSGSAMLCHGSKYRGQTITSITLKCLSTLYDEAPGQLMGIVEDEILQALGAMKQQLNDSTHSGDFEITFSPDGRITLVAQSGSSKLLPSPDVVRALL